MLLYVCEVVLLKKNKKQFRRHEKTSYICTRYGEVSVSFIHRIGDIPGFG